MPDDTKAAGGSPSEPEKSGKPTSERKGPPPLPHLRPQSGAAAKGPPSLPKSNAKAVEPHPEKGTSPKAPEEVAGKKPKKQLMLKKQIKSLLGDLPTRKAKKPSTPPPTSEKSPPKEFPKVGASTAPQTGIPGLTVKPPKPAEGKPNRPSAKPLNEGETLSQLFPKEETVKAKVPEGWKELGDGDLAKLVSGELPEGNVFTGISGELDQGTEVPPAPDIRVADDKDKPHERDAALRKKTVRLKVTPVQPDETVIEPEATAPKKTPPQPAPAEPSNKPKQVRPAQPRIRPVLEAKSEPIHSEPAPEISPAIHSAETQSPPEKVKLEEGPEAKDVRAPRIEKATPGEAKPQVTVKGQEELPSSKEPLSTIVPQVSARPRKQVSLPKVEMLSKKPQPLLSRKRKAEAKADSEAKKKAEEEAKRKAEEAKRRLAEEEALRRREEAEAKIRAKEEAQRKAREEAKRIAEEQALAKKAAQEKAAAEKAAQTKEETSSKPSGASASATPLVDDGAKTKVLPPQFPKTVTPAAETKPSDAATTATPPSKPQAEPEKKPEISKPVQAKATADKAKPPKPKTSQRDPSVMRTTEEREARRSRETEARQRARVALDARRQSLEQAGSSAEAPADSKKPDELLARRKKAALEPAAKAKEGERAKLQPAEKRAAPRALVGEDSRTAEKERRKEEVRRRPKKERRRLSPLVQRLIFYPLALALILTLAFTTYYSLRETRLDGVVAIPADYEIQEVAIVKDFRPEALVVSEDLMQAREPLRQDIVEREEIIGRAQADLAGRRERIRLLREEIDNANKEIESVIGDARVESQQVWQQAGEQMEGEYDAKLNSLKQLIRRRATELNLPYEPTTEFESPEIWVNAYRLSLYDVPENIDASKERAWVEARLNDWKKYETEWTERQTKLKGEVERIQASPKGSIEDVNRRIARLEQRIVETKEEMAPIENERDANQKMLDQLLVQDRALDRPYYEMLLSTPENNKLRSLAIDRESKQFSWRDISEGDFPPGDYLLWVKVTKGPEVYWSIVTFPIRQYGRTTVQIEEGSFVSLTDLLRNVQGVRR